MNIIRRYKIPVTRILFIAVGICVVGYFLWTSSHIVMAYQVLKRAHIFPTNVSAQNWSEPDHALSQDLPAKASLASFNQANSAYITLAGTALPPAPISTSTPVVPVVQEQPVEPVSPVVPATTSIPVVVATSSETIVAPAAPTSTSESLLEIPPDSIGATTTPDFSTSTIHIIDVPESTSTPQDSSAPVSTSTDVLPPLSSTTPFIFLPSSTDTSATTSATTTSMLERVVPMLLGQIRSLVSAAIASLATTALASTTPEEDSVDSSTTLAVIASSSEADATTSADFVQATSSSPVASDVASCTVLGIECHTIEFSGFTVAGSLTDKKLRAVEVNFSFANLSAEDQITDGKLAVRYYHKGAWHSAGEIFLNKELSNATNGGYFSSVLGELKSWDDLSDVRVVFEFERGDLHAPVQLYLDSVWLDAVYQERVQDVLSGKNNIPLTDVPDNVALSLAAGIPASSQLILSTGGKIVFPYLDTLTDDSLAVRIDRPSYKAASNATTTVIYTSITNTGTDSDSFRLYASFPGGAGTVQSVSQFVHNVPIATTSPDHIDLTYLCDSKWQLASTTGGYSCFDMASTTETLACASLNEAGTNCLVKGVAVDSATTTYYIDAWSPVDVHATSEHNASVEKGLPPGYRIGTVSDKGYEILPGQTLYFKVVLAAAEKGSARFVLSATGQKYFGDVDSLRVRDETFLGSLAKNRKARIDRAHLNDQLSEKSDFNVDELPQFNFKFKTQRPFFTRMMDVLLARKTPYSVRQAIVRHESGEIEHIPVDINYGTNDEWTFQFERPTRAFRPGKYTIDLTMDEGGQTYTDTVEFYWGVLAVNTNKSVYVQGETAHLMMTSLDDQGNTMCDAQLALSITAPSGIVNDVPVLSGGGCAHNNVTDIPDFMADYPVTDEGDYTITLSRLNSDGQIINSVTDGFSVQNAVPFSVERGGPTRIYPPAIYAMHFTVTAKQAFKGDVREVLPEGFTVHDAGGADLVRADGVIYLTWHVDLSEGATTELSYTFKAPDVSPYLYVLGPLSFKDPTTGTVIFQETRSWKIAADSLPIATGIAWLGGNQNTSATPTNFGTTTPYAITWNLSNDYDSTYFTYSTTTNPSQLQVNKDGDYLVAVDVPVERSDATGNRTTIEADIRVNGSKIVAGVGRGFTRTNATVNETSAHVYMLLHGLHATDYIESYVHQIGTALDTISIASQASMYVEYIGQDQSVYFGVSTTTESTNNINPTATTSLVWYDDPTLGRKDSGYTHDNASSTQASKYITLGSAGNYLVFVNIPDNGAVASENPLSHIIINNAIVSGAQFSQGYISNNTGNVDGSSQWSGVVTATTSNVKLEVTVVQGGALGTMTVNNDAASIYIQQLPSSGVYFSTATTTRGGSSWNQTTATSTLWTTDSIKDASVYTHSTTTNSHNITVQQSGDYLLALSDSHSGGTANTNQITAVNVNGTAQSGAQTKMHFFVAAASDFTSGSLVYLLRNLSPNDIINITTAAEGAAGNFLEAQPAHLMLWRKVQQSAFTQDAYQWWVNSNTEPPADIWPAGLTDLPVDFPMTAASPPKSGDVMRIRMALGVSTTTATSTFAFKLQYAPGSTCSEALAWSDVGTTTQSTIWRGYDNPGVITDATTTSLLLTGITNTNQSYEEQNPSRSNPNAMVAGDEGEWDWVLQDNGAAVGTDYCFRMVNSSGQVLKDYVNYPQLTTNNTPDVPTLLTLFDNEKASSTLPSFTFSSSDDNNDDIDYEIQISTDSNFGSTVVDTDSGSNPNAFENLIHKGDKAPFTTDDTVRYNSTFALTNGTTYWWRVRAVDALGTNTYSSYSAARSFTVDTSVQFSTWYQTTKEQFNNGGTLTNVAATSSDDVKLSGGSLSGSIYSPAILYSYATVGNSWGTASSTDYPRPYGSILYRVEYFTSTSSWAAVPNSVIAGNTSGTSTLPINLTSLDPTTYSQLRFRADFTATSTSPIMRDWTVAWALSVNKPTLTSPFDNEATATTAPNFIFTTTDPQSDSLVYQVQWSTDATFATVLGSATSSSSTGFSDLTNTGASSPFPSGDSIQYHIQPSSVLIDGTTYWWRVNAKDPTGGNSFSLWSTPHSFTASSTVPGSTWFQTTTDQFKTNTLVRTGASGGDATATSTTGAIGIFRSATASEILPPATSTVVFNNGWDTVVRQDSPYTFSTSNSTTSIGLSVGYYAVMYNVLFGRDNVNANRSEVQTSLNLAGTTLPIGWSQAFIRRTSPALQGFSVGGGIIKVVTEGDILKVQSFRTDTNAATVKRYNNVSGIQLIKLDDAWSYLRLSKTTKQAGPTSGNWITVSYDRDDQVDSAEFVHASQANSVTLKSIGHYLVFVNTYGALKSVSTETVIEQKLTLNNTDVEGSFSSVYMRGNANADGDYQGAVSMGIIIESTTTNSVLRVQLKRGNAGTVPWTIDADQTGAYKDRSGITIVKLPDADFIRLSESKKDNMTPAASTGFPWDTELEKDSAFTHSTGVNPDFVTASTTGDYLVMGSLFASPGTTTNASYLQGFRKNVGTLLQYGQGGAYNPTTSSDFGNWSAAIFPGVVHNDFFQLMRQATGTASAISAEHKGFQGLRIGSLSESDTNAKTMQASSVVFTTGAGPRWSTFSWTDAQPVGTSIVYQLYYMSATDTYSIIPDSALASNSTGLTSPVDISSLSKTTYGTLRPNATFTCSGGNCPSVHDWTVTWSPGITISGTIKKYDQTTNVTSGTVAVAVNGSLQSGKTGTISGGTWSIPRVNAGDGDIVTVFVKAGVSTTTRAIGVTRVIGTGNVTGMVLYEMHLTLGSAGSPALGNADIGQYDNSVSNNTEIFYDVSAGNNLTVCAGLECTAARLVVLPNTTYEPSAVSGNITTPLIQIDGTLIADSNTINVNRSWKNNAAFIKGNSTVVFYATSTSETVDSSTATSSGFYAVTFGQISGSATWSLLSPLFASSTVSVNFGTLAQGNTTQIGLGGDLTFGASGTFLKTSATTTFMGSGTNTWTDNSTSKQNLGTVVVDGTSKTIFLNAGVKATDITIGADDTLDASTTNSALEVVGNFTNNNSFVARSGTVTFTATTTGKTITPNSSAFYNLAFRGTGGNWSFTSAFATTTNDFTIATGTVSLASGTTTVGGSFTNSVAGTFMNNNGTLFLNATASGKNIQVGTSTLNYLTASSTTGTWAFVDINATTSKNVIINAGTLTLPTGTFEVGGSFINNATFAANSGTLKFTATNAQIIKLNAINAYNMTFAGVAGKWSFSDTNATSSNTVTFTNGTTTLPAGIFAIGGSFLSLNGEFSNNSGTVKFTSTSLGNSISPATSTFYNLLIDSTTGGWTITQNATSTASTTIAHASLFRQASSTSLQVNGIFTNSVGGSATDWTTSTLFLNSGATTSINTKAAGGDLYSTLLIGATSNVSMWNSSAATTTVKSAGSLYSQNHAGVNGSLYIWGNYVRSSGTENWSATTDFDGTALGAAARAVSVKVATSAVLTFSGGTLNIVGTSTATTTIANQGSSSFSFNVTGGTLFAQYYSVTNTDANGLSLSGTTNVTSMADGSFILSVPSGGTSITVDKTVIDQNPSLQILRDRFATTSAVTSGSNVTETGGNPTVGLFWWFKNGYGPFYGENYDNDPGGNPGYIEWDDSGFDVTIAGHIYTDHGFTAMTNPPCDGSTNVVTIRTSTGLSFSGTCAAGTGAYSIPHVTFVGSAVLTVYLNSNSSKRAVTITKAVTGNVSDLDLYQNAAIIRQEDATPLTIADLAFNDSGVDSAIPFAASSTVITRPDTELFIWRGKSFTPGGNVTLQSGGSGDGRDGRLYLATSSTFTAVGAQSHSIGGGLSVDSGATLTTANSTFTFTATTSGKSIVSTSTLTFYNLTFNGSGGQWSFDTSPGVATTTVTNAFSPTAGTIVGAGDLVVQAGDVTGGGTFTMSGGTVRIESTGNFGNSNSWQFKNLTLGNGVASRTTTKTGTATTTVTGVLTINANQTLNAGSGPWVLSGAGTPFIINGIFTVSSAPFTYSATGATSITIATYANLFLAPSGAGSPTYTLLPGASLNTNNITIGDGTNAVTVTANTNDPSVVVAGDVLIATSSSYTASDIGAFNVAGSWINSGTFTHSNATVLFNATATGKVIMASSSPFYNLTFNSSSGGWTIATNATSSNNTTITAATSFRVATTTSLEVRGTFSNAVNNATTTWTGSTLFLNSGTSYTVNTKTTGADAYNNLLIGANTNIRMWGSSASSTSVNSTGSLYSQNYGGVSGALNIWGAYTRSTGSDFWDYATDFDGTDISATPRQVTVSIATSSSVSISGGLLDIVGAKTATTTVQNQGAGQFAMNISGGTFTANYYAFRNMDANGLSISGTPTIASSSLSFGDFQLSQPSNASMMTVASTVIDSNPLMVIKNVKFATTTGVTNGFNVTETGVSGTYWKFNLHYGNYAGENFDNDPAGDPGYIRWDDSNIAITFSGKVYSDEGVTVSPLCDNATQVVQLRVQGAGTYSGSCNSGTGLYAIANVAYNPGDVFSLYLASSTRRGAMITRGISASTTNTDIYEHRVIVRHENGTPLTIADMDQYDSGQDSNVPFTATLGGTNTLTLLPDTKLIVWTGKTFAPAGNVTLQSGGSGQSYDGSLELYSNSTFTAAGTQSHSIGGNFTVDSGATFSPANSTITFTATTTGKTITPNTSSFYNIVFRGTGGNWSFSGNATSTNDFTIATGTVALSVGTTTIGGSFTNSVAGTFMHNNGAVVLNSTASGKSIQVGTSTLYNLTANGSGGSWSFLDTNATTSNNFIITAGTVGLPSGIFAVGRSFLNVSGAFATGPDTVKMYGTSASSSIQANGSNFFNLVFSGVGGTWYFLDTNATTSASVTFSAGTTTLPAGSLGVGGSFINTSAFTSLGSSTINLFATTTGKSVSTNTSLFSTVLFSSSSGGWTITQSATSTADTSILAASNLTLTSGTSLAVGGTFTNLVGGSATTFTGTTLFLNSGTSYSINTSAAGGDTYATLLLGTNTKLRSWNSSAATTTVGSSAYLYSQNHAAVSGSLYIFGTYVISSTTDYWSYATDFDGTALGGGSRQVNVRIATSSSISVTGGTLNIIGGPSATTTIFASGTTVYPFAVSGGTLNANYYQFKNIDSTGLNLTGGPTVTSLDYGDFELSVASGTIISVASSVVDANGGLTATNVRFASTSANTRGYNVALSGVPSSFWTFTLASGNMGSEAFDSDGQNACGHIRFDDSACTFLSESHYRFRNDDGGEGALNSTWYDLSWSKREKISITNSNATSFTNLPVRIDLPYDSDMKSSFDDIRFTDSSGTTSIPFWRERTISSGTTTVWVKISSLLASGSSTVYVYFGNAGASSADDSANTFPFIEDFESNTLSAYSGDTSGGYFATDATKNYSGTYGLAGSEVSGQTPNGIYRTGSQTAQGKTIRWFQYVDTAFDDEACGFFGVQANPSAGDYAVCLEEFPASQKRVSIAKKVHSRDSDAGGTVMASTSVNYATLGSRWLEVVVDWLTTNTINVHVYNPDGSTFASLSTTSSTYTSGGMGFGHFNQNGGWDTYTVKPYTAITPSVVIGGKQASGGATWAAAEDTAYTGTTNQNIRLRFSLQNTGSTQTGQNFRLQIAPKGGSTNCESVTYSDYNDVPVASPSCTASSVACMSTSTQFSYLASTSPSMSYPPSMRFTAGQMVEDPTYQTNALTINTNTETEVEYNFQMTSNASQHSYCLRTSNGGLDLANYDHIAEFDVAHRPSISNWTLNNAQDIALTEGATTTIYATASTTDFDGYTDIVSATGTIYRSGVSNDANCTANDNNCYQISASSCLFSSCSGNSCSLSCRADLQYFADPTDTDTGHATSTYYGQGGWRATFAVQDTTGLRDTKTTLASSTNVLTLRALNITTGGINFGGPFVPGVDSTTTATSTARNTGNSSIDVDVSGTNLSSGGVNPIPVGAQKYATTTFVYASCSICKFLSGAATAVNVNITKPTSTSTAQQRDIYFGLTIPNGTDAGTLTGVNTFTAVAPGG